MVDKLALIVFFSGMLSTVYALSMCAVPRKGWMRMMETICTGIILCYLCQLAASPFGLKIAQSPLASLSAGFWGIPGAALSTFIALWP